MTSENQDFSMHAGETKRLRVTIRDGSGALLDLTNYTVFWALIKRGGGGAPLVLKSSSNTDEIEKTDVVNGLATVKLETGDTNELGAGKYTHIAEARDGQQRVGTITTGTLTLKARGVPASAT